MHQGGAPISLVHGHRALRYEHMFPTEKDPGLLYIALDNTGPARVRVRIRVTARARVGVREVNSRIVGQAEHNVNRFKEVVGEDRKEEGRCSY